MYLCSDPIQCIYGGGKDRQKLAETFCWMTGTYINPIFMNGTIGKNIITYGIGVQSYGKDRKYQRYYQWLVPIMVLQAFIFIVPHMLWKSWENSRVSFLCKSVGMNCYIVFLG